MKKITKKISLFLITLLCGISTAEAAEAIQGAPSGNGANLFIQEKALTPDKIVAGIEIAIKSAGASQKNNWVTLNKAQSNSYFGLNEPTIFIVENSVTGDGGIVLKRASDGTYVTTDGGSTTNISEAESYFPKSPNGSFTSSDSWYPSWDKPTSGSYQYLTRFYLNDNTTGDRINISQANLRNAGTGCWTVFYVIDMTNAQRVQTNFVDEKKHVFTSTVEYNHEGTVTIEPTPEMEFYTIVDNIQVNGNDATVGTVATDKDVIITYNYTWNDLFEQATISESFPENTKWYLLRLRDSYIKYDSKTPDELSVSNTKAYSDEYWWTFSGDYANGIKVYNKAAGPKKIMTSLSPTNNEGTTYPHFEEISNIDDTKNQIWTVYPSSDYEGYNGFYLSRANETTKINLNLKNSKVVFWSAGADIGSTFRITSVSEEIANLQNSQGARPGAVGSLIAEKYTEFENELAKGTPEGIHAASEITKKAENIIAFDPSKLYRIENYMRRYGNSNANVPLDGGYLEVVDHNQTGLNYDVAKGFYANIRSEEHATALWQFISTGTEGQYYLYNINANQYIKGTDGQYLGIGTNDQTTADAIELIALGNVQYKLQKAGSSQRLHASGIGNMGGAIMYYNGGELNSASSWYLIPATEIDVTITEAGYATINYPFSVELPFGLTAYTGTVKGEKVELNEVNGNIIPANSPVILEGEAKTYTLTILPDNDTEALTSSLQGTCLSKAIDVAETAYVLAKPETGDAGFYLLESSENANRTIGQNKAYLTTTAPNGIKAFTFDFGGTTGIENTEAVTETEEYYDLQGRRVMNPTKGIYVTKSGKKVLFTK